MANTQTIAELIVKIKSDMTGVKTGLDQTKRGVKEAESKIDSSANRIASSFKTMVAAGLTIGAVVVALKKCVAAAVENEIAVSKLNQVIRSTGGIAGVTSREAQALATSLQNVTAFGDEAIMGGQTLLLTFTKIGKDIFPEATEAMLDMSEVLGQDLKSSAIQLGKALNDPIQGVSALRRVGVQLSQQQEDQIKQFMALGEVSKAQRIILGELSTQMGGQARAAAETFTGQVKQVNNSIGDLAERIGKKVLPALKEMVGVLNEGLKGIERVFAQSDLIRVIREQELHIGALKEQREALSGNDKAQKDLNKRIADAEKQLKDYNKQLRVSRGIVTAGGTRESGSYTPLAPVGGVEKPAATEDQIKAYQAARDKLLGINQDYQRKNFELTANEIDKLNIAEIEAMLSVEELKKINMKEAEEAKLNITKYYAEQRKKVEMQNALEVAQASIAFVGQTTGQLSQIFSMYTQNRLTAIDQEKQAQLDNLTAQYDADVANIEATVVSKKERDEALKALDEKRAREEKRITEKLDKDKRKIAYEQAKRQRVVDIIQATITGIQSAMNAYAFGAKIGGPVVGGIMAGISTALTTAMIAMIAKQPLPALAQGGVFSGPALIGEAGREMALPLEGDNGRAAMREMADAILDQIASRADRSPTIDRASSSGGGGGNVYLDGALVGKWISDQSANGGFQIHQRVIIS